MKYEVRTSINRYVVARLLQKKIVPDAKKPLGLQAKPVSRMAGANFVYED